ncbi:hypothetical protein [Paraburkholderia phenazinium]|uniref:hypothetical protein n=1 Tax=Paraburkholderia phenazinium TaxID=60549 RepID=UPI00158F538A|nr:hypothetical protein [Paraburkholderia phenazinium]
MKQILLLMVVFGLQACSTTAPGTAAGITYRLPRTDAKVTLGVDVEACSPVRVTSSLKVDAVAGAREGYFYVSGSELSADVTKRSLTIDVDSNGVISSINATSTDQATVIVGNLVKIGATVAAGVAGLVAEEPQVVCNDETIRNLARLTALKSSLASALAKEVPPSELANAQKNIDALASAVVAAQAKTHRDVSATIKLEDVKTDGQTTIDVPFEPAPLGKLFDTEYPNPKRTVQGVTKDSLALFRVKLSSVVGTPQAKDGLVGGSSSATDSCAASITVPAAKLVTLTLTPVGKLLDDGTKRSLPQSMYVSQIGADGTFCISAGFGENRSMGLKFDKFGQVTEFNWSADSRAANITSALAGSASDASSIVTKLAPSELTRQKAELDELTTENNLQLARHCKAILDAGGTSCSK